MTWPTALLDEAERLVNQLVHLDPEPHRDHALAARLDVLERLTELLRLRSGRLENELTMQQFLACGVAVSLEQGSDEQRVIVGGEARRARTDAGRYRRQSELQAALLLQLLHARSETGRIGDDLHRFILSVRDDLAPADVETTRTGVTRIATTTRDAARALRLYGLLRDSDETRTRKWELSLLGILTAAALSERHPKLALPAHDAFAELFGRFAESERLAAEVEAVIRSFRDEKRVKERLLAICARDRDVFPTFDTVVATLARYCDLLEAHWRALDARQRTRDAKEVRAAADAMLRAVEAAVPPGALAEDINKSLSFDQLPGFARPDQQ